jgi:hypothetical protein
MIANTGKRPACRVPFSGLDRGLATAEPPDALLKPLLPSGDDVRVGALRPRKATPRPPDLVVRCHMPAVGSAGNELQLPPDVPPSRAIVVRATGCQRAADLGTGDSPLSPAARTRLEQIADRLQAHDPQLERFTTERHIELTRADDTGIQVSLYPGEAAVAVAYWHTGPAARAVMQIVWTNLVILEQETGWEVYDGQLGRSLSRGQDLDEVTGWYADLTARLHKRFPEP